MDEAERRRLVGLIRKAGSGEAGIKPLPVLPLPPGWEEFLPPGGAVPRRIGPVRACLFDVYGTLFCSAAGEVGPEGVPDAAGPDALARELSGSAAPSAPGLSGEDLRGYFRGRVAAIHREAAGRTQWPEVRVDEIWTDFLRERGMADGFRPFGAAGTQAAAGGRELALRYELAVNPVSPMPGAAETIKAMKRAGCVLGLISNAQFFTPLLFEAFFGAPPEELGFDPELIIWSFEWGEAKPSPRLFGAAAGRLEAQGIDPGACLFVGNDMLSDISGAEAAGFRGVLFAGDGRSLRLREGDPRLRNLQPAVIVRKLGDLPELYRLSRKAHTRQLWTGSSQQPEA
ncbi:MAG: HAD family hydrolase [Treponema sp.]|jgi:putative hydrolase of the HAD superfamily|nr:HAD family hydrolase [Treponema sp.]